MRGLAVCSVVLLMTAPFGAAYAQTVPRPRAPSPVGAAVYFIDLKDGATIAPKTVVHFGLRGMGVAPAGSDRENSGHHHLLIDTELPPLNEAIPADFNHLHFGAGQTEVELNLSPGPHTLQLVLADKDHVPHNPPVMSERIHVTVAEAEGQGVASAQGSRHPSPSGAGVYFIYPKNGAYIKPRVKIRFGLTNMGVAPAGVDRPNSGHHHLLIDTAVPAMDEPIPNDPNHLHFGAGQTEAQVTLPLGAHTLQLLLGDSNHVAHDPPVISKPIHVTVTETGKRPTSRGPRRAPRSR